MRNRIIVYSSFALFLIQGKTEDRYEFIDTISRLGNHGHVSTYADEYYRRSRNKREEVILNLTIIFLIGFSLLVAGFILLYLIGMLIFGVFDRGLPCFSRSPIKRHSPTSGLYEIRAYQDCTWRVAHRLSLFFRSRPVDSIYGQGVDDTGPYTMRGTHSNEATRLDLEKRHDAAGQANILHFVWSENEQCFYSRPASPSVSNYVQLKCIEGRRIG